MKRYAEYKDTGIGFLGEIPLEWTISKLKYCVKVRNIKKNYLEGIYVGLENIEPLNGRYIEVNNQEINGVSSEFVSGDVLFGKLRPYLGKCIVAEFNGMCSTEFLVLEPLKVCNRYLKYWFLSAPVVDAINASTYGAKMPRASWDYIKNLQIPAMEKREQQAIADYLDKECAQIDSIAADLEKQIELLQQYKQSLITETVTKGLDKSVPMKDSGVEWIGEIPVGWELSRIKYLTDNHHPYPIGDGDHGMIKADDYLTEGIPYIRVLNLTWGSGLNLENLVFISKEMNSLIKNSELKPNDILIAKTGATIGKTAIVPDSLPVSNTTSHVGKITLANVHDAKYFYYVMTSSIVQKQIQDISAMQSTRPELGIEGLKNLILTVPPFDIQQHIARFLDDHCAKIDRVLHEKGKQLSVIKQHKKSLIYEYVTGKKRVKEVR